MLKMFKDFITDGNGWDMYVTGRAGTGKTTDLATSVQYCMDNNVEYRVCAFTHKACRILASKLPPGALIQTLHSFLKKRPMINQDASNVKHMQRNVKQGASDKASILFIDEYSMIGERDLMDIRDIQDADEEHPMKVVWLGDPNQLPPVGDMQSVNPTGKYCLTLTKVYRQAASNPLMTPLNQLVSYIEGATPQALVSNDNFIREQDIVEWYENDQPCDSVMLAYTNKRVQDLNARAQGYSLPKPGDKVFNASNRQHYTFVRELESYEVFCIDLPFGLDLLQLGSKYKTLEFIRDQDYSFAELEDEDGELHQFCYVFGHHNYKVAKEQLMSTAAGSNAAIGVDNPAEWARANYDTAKAKTRAKAWRQFLSFNECVCCLDFAHALTVHKSQGSTYERVYVDTQDLGLAADFDFKLYLKLMYVAISRASDTVVTN
jgi:hypothetical protein